MTRYPDWPLRLEQFLRARSQTPFAYGRLDCCLFVADAVHAMTGLDLAYRYRGQYRSHREAMALLGRHGLAPSVAAAAVQSADEFCLPSVPVLRAQRGDMLLVRRRRDYSLGLLHLDGKNVVVPTHRHGLWLIPTEVCEAAWRI